MKGNVSEMKNLSQSTITWRWLTDILAKFSKDTTVRGNNFLELILFFGNHDIPDQQNPCPRKYFQQQLESGAA